MISLGHRDKKTMIGDYCMYYRFVRLSTSKRRRKFKPCLQNRVLLPRQSSFRNFARSNPVFFVCSSPLPPTPRHWEDRTLYDRNVLSKVKTFKEITMCIPSNSFTLYTSPRLEFSLYSLVYNTSGWYSTVYPKSPALAFSLWTQNFYFVPCHRKTSWKRLMGRLAV